MKLSGAFSYLLFAQGLLAHLDDEPMARRNASMENVLLPRSGSHNGRVCDFSDGYYVNWPSTSDAIISWCAQNKGKQVTQGQILSSTVQDTSNPYKSGYTTVELYVKYQNDHIACWFVEEEACNWYLSYIAQGCTKGGDRPTDPKNQATDGGTFYEPSMGSIDMKWSILGKSEF